MAIVGTWRKYTYTKSQDQFEEYQMTYSENIPEGSPDYDKRGTTETVQRPVVLESFEDFENSYVNISAIMFFPFFSLNEDGTERKQYVANITYRVYDSKQSRIDDINNFVYQDVLNNIEFDSTIDMMTQAYDLIRANVRGFENLIND